MKVAYICAKHPAYDGRVYYKISMTLAKRYEVINVIPNVEGGQTTDGICFIGYQQKPGMMNRIRSLFSLYRICTSLNTDIMIAPEPDSLLVCFLANRKKRTSKVIFDCHEWYHLQRSGFWGSIACACATVMINYLAGRIDGIWTVNDTMTEYYKQFNCNTTTIPSLADRVAGKEPHVYRNRYCFFGQFGKEEHKEQLLMAARKLKATGSTAQIEIIGGYQNTLHNAERIRCFSEEIALLGLEGNISFSSWVARDEAFEKLATYDAGIMRFDGKKFEKYPALPNKFFEYISMGMLIVGYNGNADIRKIVEENNCGVLLQNESGEELADKILYLEKHPEEAILMRRNALAAAKTRYNWDNYSDIIKKTFEG